jgi:hypothetical protein
MSSLSIQAKVARPALPRWLPLLLVFVLAILVRGMLATNPDVSWGLTMAEKWLDGGRLYIDIVEVNPPATVYLYVPPVVLSHLTGLSAEVFVDVLVLLAAASSLLVSARVVLAGRLLSAEQGWMLVALTAAILVILPARAFAEREHVALIAMLPLLAVNWLRAEHKAPPLWIALVAGIGGGLTAIIKPYFAAAVLCSAAAAAWSARSWRVLFALENLLAAAMLAAYVAFVWLAYPIYFADMLPLLAAVYIPVKEPLASFLLHAAAPLWMLLLLSIWSLARHAVPRPPVSLLLAASTGFVVAYFVQQKGWPNHAYPMLALALLAFGQALMASRAERTEQYIASFIALLVTGVTFYWMGIADDRAPLANAIRGISPHAKVLAISPDLTIGHPAVRTAGGFWVSRVSALWITQGALMVRARGNLDPVAAARLDSYAERDRTMLSVDINRNRPDVILAEREPEYDWLAWARSDPLLANDLKPYRLDRTIGDVIILRRIGTEK